MGGKDSGTRLQGTDGGGAGNSLSLRVQVGTTATVEGLRLFGSLKSRTRDYGAGTRVSSSTTQKHSAIDSFEGP